MQYHEYISDLRQRTGAASEDEALNITRGVLQTLADHLAGNAPAKLAAQLPEEIGALITEYKSDPDAEGEKFGADEFIERVTTRTGAADSETGKKYAVAVLASLKAAVSGGEFEKMRGTLPDDYAELFGETASNSANN